jgi:hypothetical protein
MPQTIFSRALDGVGEVAVEWVLLLGAIIVPMTAVIFKVMDMVIRYYSVTSWCVSLPFP